MECERCTCANPIYCAGGWGGGGGRKEEKDILKR